MIPKYIDPMLASVLILPEKARDGNYSPLMDDLDGLECESNP